MARSQRRGVSLHQAATDDPGGKWTNTPRAVDRQAIIAARRRHRAPHSAAHRSTSLASHVYKPLFSCSGFNFVFATLVGPGKWGWDKRKRAVTIVTHGSTNETHSDGAPPLGGGGRRRLDVARLRGAGRRHASYAAELDSRRRRVCMRFSASSGRGPPGGAAAAQERRWRRAVARAAGLAVADVDELSGTELPR